MDELDRSKINKVKKDKIIMATNTVFVDIKNVIYYIKKYR